jgi:hypothetical protein
MRCRGDCSISVTFHPATLLFAWGGFVAMLQALPPDALGWIAAILLPLAIFVARRRVMALVRRTRWLLISIAILFAFATPGQRLPGIGGDLGITFDGLLLAAEHLLRLLLLLASLAAVHERLGTTGMMMGLHWLLGPLGQWRTLRERIVVRTLLVLDQVENAPVSTWREWLKGDTAERSQLSLTVGSLRAVDWLVLASLVMIILLSGVIG